MNRTDHVLGLEHRQDGERGMAIILALFFAIITAGLVTSGTLMMKSTNVVGEVRFRRDSQATQFARSGLTEALSWFRRQTAQPVTNFQPLLNAAADPKILDTDDPTIGLVRDFQIANDIWGRYEVWRKDESDPIPSRLEFRRKYEVKDLSNERGLSVAGGVWLLRSIGYVYQKRSASVAWNALPNRVLASASIECEIQRLTLAPPTQAAMSVRKGEDTDVKENGRVRGGATAAGIYYPAGSGTPETGPPSENRVTGTPRLLSDNNYDDSIKAVTGVTREELRSMADLVITDADDFPDPIPDNSIVFVEVDDIEFDSSRGLNGTGVVYIDGKAEFKSGNQSNFNGLLYVDGDELKLDQTCSIQGCVIATDKVTIEGDGDFATVEYDDGVLSALRAEIGQYRWSGAYRSIINRE